MNRGLLSTRSRAGRMAAAALACAAVLVLAVAVSSCMKAPGGGDPEPGGGRLRPLARFVLCVARRSVVTFGAALVEAAMVACFVFVFVVVPGASFVARMLAHGTASAWMVTSAVLAIGLSALYYLRYHYEARWKSSPGLSDSANGAADRFDLHPDVVRNDDDDEQSYISSLEARSGRGHGNHGFDESRRAAGRQPGIGFPADFLHMFMKSISIFGYIEEPVFHEFSRQLQTRRLLAGERMFESESDRDDQNFYVVIDGQVQIYLADAASRIPAPPPGSGSASDVGADDSASEGWSDAEGELDGALPMAPDAESSAPDLGSETAGGHPEPEEALLLNVVGPGDVLSSLLSILSLFAEGVPLRQRRQQQTGNSPPAAHTPRPAQRSGVYRALGGAPAAASQPVPPMRAHMSQLADMLAHGQENSSSKSGHGEPRPLRPNVVARATTDTTLAMIPATAFQRVTRLYPKAAAHILQVILTRLQRVTFATLYDYLDLPDELVAIERAICDLARLPLMPEIAQSDTLWRVRSLHAQADDVARGGASAIQSPTLGSRRKPSLSSRTSPSAGLASTHTVNLSSARQLPAAWKICRESLEALGARCALSPTGLPVGVAMEAAPVDADLSMGIGPAATQLPRSRFRRHRRRGSDSAPAGSLPSAADVEVLRRDALQQLCDSLGIDPNTLDGHPAPPSPGHPQARDRTPPLSMESAGSSARASRSSSVHRRSLPRTEYLLPLLQSVGLSEQKRASAAAPAAPLAQLASLTDEFGLYHVPDGQVLVEQGQRPPGLFVVLSGKVIITHRDSVSDFTGVGRDGERSFTTGPAKDPAAKTVSEVTRSMALLALKVKTNFERRERARTSRQRAPSASAQPATDSRGDRQPTGGLNGPPMPSAEVRRCRGGTSRRSRSYYARAGSIVGYLPALTDMASLYTASSVSGVVVGFISHWALERMAERYPVVLMTLARRLTSQLPAAILNIDYALEWVQVKASQMVYRQGESSDAVYVVLSGRLRAFVEKSNGGIGILAEFGQGQSVGEPNLLLNDPCGFSLHAIRDTELVRIPRALFTALMQSAPNLTFHLSQTLAVRTTQSLQRQHLMAERQSARQPVGAPHPEAGIRSHNKNLKSIALIPVDDHVPIRAFAEQLEAALSGIAGRVALLDHTAMSRVLGRHAFSRIARLKIVGWVAELEQRCRLLLHVADGGASSPWTRHCVHHSDFVLLVGLGDGDPRVGDYERLLLALKTTARKELVLLHETRTCGTGVTAEWLKRRPWVHAHHHIQMPLGYDDFDLDAEPSRRPASGLLD
ncbi:Nte1p, partial [Coemansia biformis]